VTLIVALAVEIAVSNLPGLNATAGIFLSSPLESTVLSQALLYELMVVVLAITILAARVVERSKWGLGLYAIREDEEVASTQGIDTTKVKIGAFVVSAALAGLAGGIYAWFLGYVTPTPMFDVRISILVVLIALLGGTQSWIGPFLGAVLLRVVDQVLVLQFGGQTAQIMYGLMLVVVIMFLPQGLYPHVRQIARNRLPANIRTLGAGGESS
jgi:branched-chain amino acid transport system permease protein